LKLQNVVKFQLECITYKVFTQIYMLLSRLGAGSDIGREICRVLAREGARLVVTDQDIKSAEETVAILEGYISAIIFSVNLIG